MTRANSEQPPKPDNSRPENGSTDETPVTPVAGHTPSTENSEVPSLGGLRFVQLTKEEGEEVWEGVFAPHVSAFIPPDETDPKSPEPELTRDQLRSLTISFLDQLIASPPRATPESNMPSPDRLTVNRALVADATETQRPHVATNLPGAATPSVRPVPPGLVRCPVCNEYRGTSLIDDQSPHSRKREMPSPCFVSATEFLAVSAERSVSTGPSQTTGAKHQAQFFIAPISAPKCLAPSAEQRKARTRPNQRICLAGCQRAQMK